MQMPVKILIMALLSVAAAEETNPIQKVVELISSLQAKLMKEKEFADKAYKEFFEWCDDAAKEKAFEVKTATAEKEKLEATIAKCVSDADDAMEAIAELAQSIATAEGDLKNATLIREKEHADFAASEKELMDAIDMLDRAIGIIEREMKGSALLQKPIDHSSISALIQSVSVVIEAASFSNNDKQKLMSLIQGREGDDDQDAMDSLGAPDPTVYKSKSGGIVETLTDMKDKAEEQLAEERKAEANLQHNYDMLKQDLTDQIAAAEHEKAENEAAKQEADELKAQSEGDLEVTVKDLTLAQETLSQISADCMEKATDHEVSMQGYADELKALDVAKKILQETSSGAEAQAYGFLQVSSSSRLRTAADLKNFEVVNVVQRLAEQHKSAALAQLASRISAAIKYGQASGEDPFAKVKGLIVEMIDKLMKEAAAEASHKAYCDEEMSKTKAKKDDLTADIDKLTAKIDEFTAKSADLKTQVKELQKELAELAEMQAEMDKVRADSKAAFEKAKEELTLGLEGVRTALGVLRDYYGGGEEALLQDESKFGAFMQRSVQPAVPEVHKPSTGAGGGIISMLEVIESDFAKNLAQEEAEEEAAQTEYDKLTQENKVTKTTKEQDVKYKTKEYQGLDKEIAELTSDREGKQTELDAVLEYYEKIKEECIAKPEPYEERKKRREAEIAGLKEALSILEGAAFVQQHSGLRGIRRL